MNEPKPPSPRRLLTAHRTMNQLSWSVGMGKVKDLGGKEMWDSVVEGRRGIAVFTAYLADTVEDEALGNEYAKAWERMVKG